MKTALQNVTDFHRACDVPILTAPQFAPHDRMELRERLLMEERGEYVEAIERRDIVALGDAIGDMIYILIGTAVECGIPLDRVWAEIQRSNMAKVDVTTGKAKHREDGKILKPPGWTPPDIRKAMGL